MLSVVASPRTAAEDRPDSQPVRDLWNHSCSTVHFSVVDLRVQSGPNTPAFTRKSLLMKVTAEIRSCEEAAHVVNPI